MPTMAVSEAIRQDIKDLLPALTNTDIASLAKKEELGSMSFETGLPAFERTLRLYRELSKVQLDAVPYGPLTTIRDRVQEANSLFNQIKEFSFAKYPNNAQNQRDSLIN